MVNTMRNRLGIFVFAVLAASSAHAQHLAPDSRPFGKYLLKICTWERTDAGVPYPQVRCLNPVDRDAIVPNALTPQSIDFKQVSEPGSVAGQNPAYPLAVNQSFWISAKATSGLPVTITRRAGTVIPQTMPAGAPPDVYQYLVVGPGTVVLEADQSGDGAFYQPASPVILVFDVGPAGDPPCGGLFPAPTAPRTVATIDATAIVGLLGVPLPYVLTAAGPRTILIYTTRDVFEAEGTKKVKLTGAPIHPTEIETRTGIGKPTASETDLVRGFEQQIQALLNRNADTLGLPAGKPFTMELKVPHASALGDLATRISGLNYSQITVADVGRDKIRVTAATQPDCPTWTSFLTDVREMAWQLEQTPWNTRLYYVGQNTGVNGASQTGATDVATAFGALAPTSAAPAASAPAAAASPASSSPSAPAAATATIAVSQPPGSVLDVKSDTTPCVIAGLTMGNSSACAGTGAATSAAGLPSAPAAPPTPAAPAAAPSIAPLEADLLLFSTPNPGDDGAIEERKRIIAQLDLPRPEMIINGWVLQNSTTDSRAIGAFASQVKELVGNYNDALERMMGIAWASVRARIAQGNFFNVDFYHYIADRYVGDTSAPISGKDPQSAAQQFLNSTTAKLGFPNGTTPTDYGICESGRYCLGYTNLFQPLKPRLTDVLLTLIAARDTLAETEQTIDDVEAPVLPTPPGYCDSLAPPARDRCRTIWKDLDLDNPGDSCERRDLHAVLGSAFTAPPEGPWARVYLNCFRREAERLMRAADPNPASSPSAAGLMRATVANFLFQYKLSQQFPHEFSPYDLSQSADALNSALNPLIDAFNRDITSYQRFVRADVLYRVDRLNREYDGRCCAKRLFGLDKPSFFNEGIVTVRTISGQWTYASTTSQSFLNASSAPQLTDVLNGLTAAGASSTSKPPIAALLPGAGALSSAQLAAAYLNNYQTTYAQIGRSLAISAIPRSLSTASAAEIVVSLNADDAANPPVYVGGPQSGDAANISRVANHDTSTRVRVESLKLFEVSSFAAVLERSRSRIPLVPPFVEIPYIGTLAGIPVPPAKEYHQSTALLSAIVVPTAADIAFGMQFQFDQTAQGAKQTCSLLRTARDDDRCRLRKVQSLADYGERNSVELFNRAMVHCLATDMRSAYSSIQGFTAAAASVCSDLKFDSLPYSR